MKTQAKTVWAPLDPGSITPAEWRILYRLGSRWRHTEGELTR